jgi:hypothetical protein
MATFQAHKDPARDVRDSEAELAQIFLKSSTIPAASSVGRTGVNCFIEA